MFQINGYAIKQTKVFPIHFANAGALNEDRAEIYWTPNNFSEWGRRTKKDLVEITCFYCEIDELSKKDQKELISRGPTPSSVIETKRGFQMYWYLTDPIDCRENPEQWADWFHSFVAKRIVPLYGADPQAADACRLLRMPFYRYWKDGLGEFIIDISFDSNCTYTLDQMEKYFPPRYEPLVRKQIEKRPDVSLEVQDFWSKANHIDCREGLLRLSGTTHVSGERISFKEVRNGTRIVIDGKARNVWIDKDGKIGSTAEGGPSIPNWLFYYHKDWKKVASILKEVFPEIVK